MARSADGYDPTEVEAYVRCHVVHGPPLHGLRLTRAQTIRGTRRVILRNSRSPSTRLGRLLRGKRFRLRRPGTVEFERHRGPNVLVGGSYNLRFPRPVHLAGVVPATGWPPKGASQSYTRRYGYMPYLTRVAGTVTSLDVTVDLRRKRIEEVIDGFFSTPFAYDPVPGPCPLGKPPPSTD